MASQRAVWDPNPFEQMFAANQRCGTCFAINVRKLERDDPGVFRETIDLS